MSVWRDIWRDCVRANRMMAENEEDGLQKFHELFKRYGDDGMIHYVLAESYEKKDKKKAIDEYKKAKELFPVDHWQKIAQDSIDRIMKNRTPEQFYDTDDFEEYLWYGFQKVYEYTHLNDFVRYISLSAFSRGSSEWPLSLVDFRTVTELEIKEKFPEVVSHVKNSYEYSLYNVIKELGNRKLIDLNHIDCLHRIRKAGNIAAHDGDYSESEKLMCIEDIVEMLRFFNNYKGTASEYMI